MSISISTVWLIIAVIFGLGELMTSGFTLIWFSISAVVLMLISIFIESILTQIIIFAIISIALLIVGTKYLVKRDENVKYNTNLQGILSKQGIVVKTIEPYEVGLVKVNGEEWSAVSRDNVEIAEGKLVRILEIEGVKLIVEEIKPSQNFDDKDSISKEIDITIKTID